jgi:hypothetical protein
VVPLDDRPREPRSVEFDSEPSCGFLLSLESCNDGQSLAERAI